MTRILIFKNRSFFTVSKIQVENFFETILIRTVIDSNRDHAWLTGTVCPLLLLLLRISLLHLFILNFKKYWSGFWGARNFGRHFCPTKLKVSIFHMRYKYGRILSEKPIIADILNPFFCRFLKQIDKLETKKIFRENCDLVRILLSKWLFSILLTLIQVV